MGKKQHPGSIEERGNGFRVRLCVDGERHYFHLTDVTREQAEEYATEKDLELRRRVRAGLPGQMPFSAIVRRFRDEYIPQKAPETRRGYHITLDAAESYFVDQLGDPQADSIRKGHVSRYLEWRRLHEPDGSKRTEPLSARTLAKDRATLSSMFSFADELELVRGNPAQRVRVPKGDTREPIILDLDQYEALLSACEGRPMLWPYVLTLGETGVRCESEALWLRWDDVDFETGLLTVESVRKGRRTKSGKSRRVPMTRRLRAAMRDHFAEYRFATYDGEGTPWIFHHTRTLRRAVGGRRIKSLRSAFNRAKTRADRVPDDLVQHDLRHRRVTTWLAQGKAIHKVAKAMGHSTVQVTERYMHLVAEDTLSLVEPGDVRSA